MTTYLMRGRDGKIYTRREQNQDAPLPGSKFSASDIRAIRAEHSTTVPQPSLAQLGRKYDVTPVCIGNIVNRKVFQDID